MKAACSDAKAIPPFSHVILECVLERARASVHEEHKDGASDMVKRKALSDGDTSSTKHIANRMKRQEVYQRIKKGKKDIKKAKKEQRKRDAEDPEKKDLPKQVPKTLDTLREYDETIVPAEDDEVAGEEMMDEFASYFRGESAPARLPPTQNTVQV